MPVISLFVSIFLLVGVDIGVAAVKAALFHAHLARLLSQREQREKGVRLVIELLHSKQHLKISLQLAQVIICFLISGLLLTWVVLFSATPLNWLLWSGVLILGGILLMGMEQLAEAVVCRAPEKWAIRLAPLAKAIKFLLAPFTALFLVLSRREEDGREGTGAVTEDELKILVDAGKEEGILEQDEREMIFSIFRLGDTLAREIMVPRIYITALDVSLSLPEAVEALLASGHSRVPVYEETIDHIIGLVYAKDLLGLWLKGDQSGSLRGVLRPAYFVPEAKKIDELLDEMQARHVHMAIVIDEYGGVAGLVTLEDIVEEIVGEIRDEYDQAEEVSYQVVGEDEYVFLGRVDLDDFNELMGTNLPRDEADTIGGFMYSQLGHVPVGGESIQVENVVLTVEQVSGRRIRKVRARKILPLPHDEGEKDDYE